MTSNPFLRSVQVKAFTLIELLVVISIIGILAALILAPLSRAKNKAIQTIDVANLKQIITATQMYAADDRDILPWPNWKIGDSATRPGWLYQLNPSVAGPAQFDITSGLFWQTLKNQKLYRCPMDDPTAPLFNKRQQQLSSYAMTGAVIGFDRTNYPAARLSSMLGDDVAFWETDERVPQYFNDGANFPKEGVSGRHLKGAINVALSGAVTYVRLGSWYLQVYDTNKNRLWCYPRSPNGR